MTTMLERRRVLVIDDSDAIHGDFRKTLERRARQGRLAAATTALFGAPAQPVEEGTGFDVDCASQGQEGLEKIAAGLAEGRPYAMAFVDMRMPPGWDGVETIKHLWEADPDLQVVICTAFTDYSWDQITASLGQTDRLLILKKPFDPMEVCQLAAALSEKWKLKRQANLKVVELEKMVEERTTELRQLALMDRLTGLPNRAYIMDLLNKAMKRAADDPTFEFAVHFVDCDRFKLINDSLGHEVGDQLLTSIAERLRRLLGQAHEEQFGTKNHVAARLGGDEFVVLQMGIQNISEATELAERILTVLAVPHHLKDFEVHSTASIGIATSEERTGISADMLREADSAMYRAKSLGKARYAIFNREMHELAVARLTMESDLRRALKQGELSVHYQPIYTLAEKRLAGFEALARWKHKERGWISPVDFIPVAEETSLIVALGEWVLEAAVRQLRDWTRTMPFAEALTMSVNCSRKQLANPGFPGCVAQTLAINGIAPARLNLEITESSVMHDQQSAKTILTHLRSMGVNLHLDDFGTGYSSLNCLHGLPLDVLKVDRSFIRTVGERRDYAAVIGAIIVLAHNLGMKVIAEGVETTEHTAMLCALDCDQAQGFYFARPMPAEQIPAYVMAHLGASTAQGAWA